jgi:hypothetical protein
METSNVRWSVADSMRDSMSDSFSVERSARSEVKWKLGVLFFQTSEK